MPAIDFPAAPAVNDEYSFEGRTWRWNGTGWEVKEYPAALLAGTAANPSLYFSGDPNTGLYSPGADQVAVATNGTGRLFVASDGSVGIGQASDNSNYRLNIYNSSADFCAISIGNNVSGSGASNGLVLAQNQADSLFLNRENGYMSFSTNNTEKLRITSGGLVGIGTSSPSAKLQIDTSTDADGVRLLFASTPLGTTGPAVSFSNYNNSNTPIVTSSIKGVMTGGAVGAEAGDLRFNTATGGAAPTERLRITAAGLVGIGTTSPGAQLEINGAVSKTDYWTPAGKYSAKLGLVTGTDTDIYAGITGSYQAGSSANLILQARFSDLSTVNGVVLKNSSSNVGGLAICSLTATAGGAVETERARIDSSGQLIIAEKANGLTNGVIFNVPYTGGQANGISQCLQVAGTGNVNVLARINMSTNDLASNNSSYISFATSSGGVGAPSGDLTTERMRIDSSGRLLVGTSSTAEGSAAIFQGYNGVSANPGVVRICKGVATPANGEVLGYLTFGDSTHKTCGAIQGERDGGTWSASSVPTRLVFSTTADGASSPTERMRINSNGVVSIGAGGNAVQMGNGAIIFGGGAFTSGAGTNALKWNNTTGVVTWDSSSRLVKENIEDLPYGIAELKLLKPRKYFRLDDEKTEIGFIADEVADVIPELVSSAPRSLFSKNLDDDQLVPASVAYEKMTSLLAKALQEAIGRIETLEAKVAALEGA